MKVSLLSKLNIHQKLYVFVGGAITLALVTLGAIAVARNAKVTRLKTYGEAEQVVTVKAREIEQFFAERARVVDTFLLNPALSEFFNRYDTYRAPVFGNPDYTRIIDYFDAIVANDDSIKAVFFADEDSQDYFSNRIPEIPAGRVEEEGYRIKNRPWWHEAVSEDKLYLASPTVDLVTGEVAVVLQTTVYREDGTLLGVGGADVLLTTVGDLVGQMRYQGDGVAFLVDQLGEVIYFTGGDVEIESELDDFDELFEESSGFADLGERIRSGDRSHSRVRWQGTDCAVFLAPIDAESPYIDWTLGILVPESIINAPIRSSIVSTALAVLFTICCVGGIVLFVSRLIVTWPIRRLLVRFQDIASGDADLTHRVEVSSSDEIGRLGESFNNFVAGIQEDIGRIGKQSTKLAGSSDEMRHVSQQIASAYEETSNQASMVSSSAEQVSANIQSVATATEELNANTREIATNASDAAQVASRAVELAGGARETVEQLNESGITIAEFVKVINAIAEQTNLLALNATIEAARAGEAGRGFAVVADEVKKLAGQTSRATKEIGSTADLIGSHTKRAADSIEEISDIIRNIYDIQTTIASGVEEQTATTAEIARSVTEAAAGSSDIADRIAGIAASVEQVSTASKSTRQGEDELAAMAAELKQIVARFKY